MGKVLAFVAVVTIVAAWENCAFASEKRAEEQNRAMVPSMAQIEAEAGVHADIPELKVQVAGSFWGSEKADVSPGVHVVRVWYEGGTEYTLSPIIFTVSFVEGHLYKVFTYPNGDEAKFWIEDTVVCPPPRVCAQ